LWSGRGHSEHALAVGRDRGSHWLVAQVPPAVHRYWAAGDGPTRAAPRRQGGKLRERLVEAAPDVEFALDDAPQLHAFAGNGALGGQCLVLVRVETACGEFVRSFSHTRAVSGAAAS
jgi:hypothetical protein